MYRVYKVYWQNVLKINILNVGTPPATDPPPPPGAEPTLPLGLLTLNTYVYTGVHLNALIWLVRFTGCYTAAQEVTARGAQSK